MVYFSDLLAVKHVNLVLRLKLYVAFIDLNILKIVLCEWNIKFKIKSVCNIDWILTGVKSQRFLCQQW